MIPEIRLLAAKTSRDNDNLWLPLLDHLKDTAGVIEYLSSRWLPGSVYDEMEISRKEGIRLAKLLALLHDIGKGIPAFQTRILEQLPDINVEFVVGNNNLDFYKFLKENGGLPDIITCCRFSLHDASPLKDSLMDLSTTNAAGAVYDTYLSNFRNEDGSVNWLPVCADAHGFVVNKDLFEQ